MHAHRLRREPILHPGRLPSALEGADWRQGEGDILAVGSFIVRGGKIVAIDFLADPNRLRQLDITIPAD